MQLSGSRRQKRNRWLIDQADTLCGICGNPGATEVDHIVPLARGGADELSNLRPVHRDCHRRKSEAERRQGVAPTPDQPSTAPTSTAAQTTYGSGSSNSAAHRRRQIPLQHGGLGPASSLFLLHREGW
jgi:hypothetical protein